MLNANELSIIKTESHWLIIDLIAHKIQQRIIKIFISSLTNCKCFQLILFL